MKKKERKAGAIALILQILKMEEERNEKRKMDTYIIINIDSLI